MENRAEKNEVCTTFEAEGTTKEDSKAFVLAPAAKDAEALAVVPLSETPTKRYEFSQRRIRRPFSVSEVEALVEAVETLGAGRCEYYYDRNAYGMVNIGFYVLTVLCDNIMQMA